MTQQKSTTNNLRYSVKNLPSVKTFLDSVERNSRSTARTYLTGLVHFEKFLESQGLTVQTVIKPLVNEEIDLYRLLDGFVGTLKCANRGIRVHLAAVRSYLAYYDIYTIPEKFKRKIRVPKVGREEEEALDVNDIRNILLQCSNRRLKTFIELLGSGGFRASEALAIRLCDIDFSVNPTKIHVRKEYTKTRNARDVYISDEATQQLKQWIDWKYRDTYQDPKSLVFAVSSSQSDNPVSLYPQLNQQFGRLLQLTDYSEKKDGTVRRKITFHTLRRFTKTVISDQVNQDYSEWFLGHNKSPYYTKKEQDRKEIYATKCMKYLTFLDYGILEATGKNIEAKLSEKESEIQAIKMKYEQDMQKIREEMNQQFNQIVLMIQGNPKLAQVKPEVLTSKRLV
jgi:integrase